MITTTNKKTQNNHLKTTGNNHKGPGGPGSSVGLRRGQGAGLGGGSEQGPRELGKGPWGARRGVLGNSGGARQGVLAGGGLAAGGARRGSCMTLCQIACFNSPRVPRRGFRLRRWFFKNHFIVAFSCNLLVTFAMKLTGFMLVWIACFVTLNDCSQLTVVGTIVFALMYSVHNTGYC